MGDKYLSEERARNVELNELSQTSYRRINRLITLVEVIYRTPDPQPYRHGSTYIPLLTKWIPRIFWENKPRETLGNDWGRSYQLINNDNLAISFNLPWIAEMYMNFGFLGILGVSFLLGLLFYVFKVTICQASNDPSRLAFGCILMIPLMFPESHLSMVLGGVIVQSLVMLLAYFLFSKLLPSWFVVR